MTEFYRSRKRRNLDPKAADSTGDRPSKRSTPTQDLKKAKSILTGKPRKYTVSVAIPSSIIDHAPTIEMKTILAGQIGRILSIYAIDEVVIYEDKVPSPQNKVNPSLFLARVLQYMEIPQYLRKALVPITPDLKFAGLLPPLDVAHHPAREEITIYREGVTLDKSSHNEEDSTMVDVGLLRRARINKSLKPGIRVTVEFNEPVAASDTHKGQKPINGRAVNPKVPREVGGIYWGYSIRLASSFSRIMTECSYKDGYDYTIGVSDKDAKDMYDKSVAQAIKPFEHLLITFGGPVGGLQEAVEADEDLKIGGDESSELFDLFIDPNAKSGSRTVRLEESMMMTMAVLKPVIDSKGK